MFIVDLKKMVGDVQNNMVNVSMCIPSFLPLDRDEKVYNTIKSLEDGVDEQAEILDYIENFQEVSVEELELWKEFSSIVNVYILASREENIISLHKEYDELVENHEEDLRDTLLFMKVKIYDTFLDNVAKISRNQTVAA